MTHEVEDVRRYALDTPEQYTDTDCMSWYDIRQYTFGAECMGLPEADDTAFKKAREPVMWKLLEDFQLRIRAELTIDRRGLDLEDASVIGEDLGMLAFRRCLIGVRPSFLEALFEVYQSGGYPCGWEGLWPEGQLVVYYPALGSEVNSPIK